jgi:hypothetical protein
LGVRQIKWTNGQEGGLRNHQRLQQAKLIKSNAVMFDGTMYDMLCDALLGWVELRRIALRVEVFEDLRE